MTRRPPQDPSDEHGIRSALRDPVGPEGRGVYLRRRIIVLLGLLAVVAVIVLIVVRPGPSSTAGSNPVEVPSDVAEKPAAQTTGEPAACGAAELEVLAITDHGTYGEGESPQFSLSVKNTGKAACIAELGTAGMSFTVTSGSDDVWRSTDCQSNAENLPVELQPGELLETEAVAWDRTRSSAETCDTPRDPVVAGGASYHLAVAVAGVAAKESAQFLLY